MVKKRNQVKRAEHARKRTPGSPPGFQELPWSASNDCSFAPPTLFNSANNPSSHTSLSSTPNFLATPIIAPITPSSSQPLTPSFHPLASHPNCCPLSKHLPSSLSFSRPLLSPLTAVNAPRTVVLSVIHRSSKPTRLSPIQSSPSLSLSLSPSLSLWLSLPLSPGSKIFTAAAAVRSHGHKTL